MACSRRNEHDVPHPSWPMDSKITFLLGPILSEKTIWTKNERSFFQPAVRGRPACLWASISVHDIEVSPIVRDRPKTWFTTGIDSLQSCRRNRIPTGSFRVQVGLAEDPNNALDNLYYPYPCCMSWYIFVDFHGWLRTATDSTHIHEGLSKFSNFSGSQVGQESLVCLEGKSMTPRRGIGSPFSSLCQNWGKGRGPVSTPLNVPDVNWHYSYQGYDKSNACDYHASGVPMVRRLCWVGRGWARVEHQRAATRGTWSVIRSLSFFLFTF